MKKSNTNSLTLEQKAARKRRIEETYELYQKRIDETVQYFFMLNIPITFTKEFKFGGNFRFDYWSTELGLAIEFDGGNGRGGHAEYNRYVKDLEKFNLAVSEGFGDVFHFILDTLPEVKNKVYAFYKNRSKHLGGTTQSFKIDKLNRSLGFPTDFSDYIPEQDRLISNNDIKGNLFAREYSAEFVLSKKCHCTNGCKTCNFTGILKKY